MNRNLLLGLIAGFAFGFGVYAIYALSGNRAEPAGSAAEVATAAAERDCEASLARGESLNAYATGEVAAFRPVSKPLDVSEIAFKNVDGEEMTLADWRGKTILFNLWATWCPPCREEMPYFEQLQTSKANDRFDVVAVSVDLGTDEKPRAFYEEIGIEALPFYQDATMEAFQSLRKEGVALGMPTTLIVDTNGCALGVLNGPAAWAGPDAVKLLDEAIALDSI